jgi:hypothetical protein
MDWRNSTEYGSLAEHHHAGTIRHSIVIVHSSHPRRSGDSRQPTSSASVPVPIARHWHSRSSAPRPPLRSTHSWLAISPFPGARSRGSFIKRRNREAPARSVPDLIPARLGSCPGPPGQRTGRSEGSPIAVAAMSDGSSGVSNGQSADLRPALGVHWRFGSGGSWIWSPLEHRAGDRSSSLLLHPAPEIVASQVGGVLTSEVWTSGRRTRPA